MSGPIAERSSLNLSLPPTDWRLRPEVSAAQTPARGQDSVVISRSALTGTPSEEAEAERILDWAIRPALEASAERRDVLVPAPVPPLPGKSPIAIQKLRFADNYDNGRETELDFERYPGDLTPRPQPPVFVTRDPRTGGTDLALREVRARLSGGDYDVYVKITGDGSIGIDRVMKGGRNVTDLAKDALLAKIKEDPALYGMLSGVAVAGAVAAAHAYAKRSGDPIEFEAFRYKLVERDHFRVEGKFKGELTGTRSFVRPASAELAAHYGDERLDAFASAKYHLRDEEWEANLGANYKLDKNTNLTAGAYYRGRSSDYGAFVGLTATF